MNPSRYMHTAFEASTFVPSRRLTVLYRIEPVVRVAVRVSFLGCPHPERMSTAVIARLYSLFLVFGIVVRRKSFTTTGRERLISIEICGSHFLLDRCHPGRSWSFRKVGSCSQGTREGKTLS